MYTNFVPLPQRSELIVELIDDLNCGSFSSVVLNEETNKVTIEFEENGRVVTLDLAEFEQGLREAKQKLGLDDELGRIRKALEQYADPKNWKPNAHLYPYEWCGGLTPAYLTAQSALAPSKPLQNIGEELERRLQMELDHYNGELPERVAIAWGGYLAGLIEWGIIGVQEHDKVCRMLPAIVDNPVVDILLGRHKPE